MKLQLNESGGFNLDEEQRKLEGTVVEYIVEEAT